MIKHTDLINTLVACVCGFGFIAGLLRYVDDWREARKKEPLPFSITSALWEAFSGGVTSICVFWILQGYGVNELASVGLSFMSAYLGVKAIVYYIKRFFDNCLGNKE